MPKSDTITRTGKHNGKSESMRSTRNCKYVFIDESGNFDFSSGGTRYFTFTSVVCQRPFAFGGQLMELKYDLLEEGVDIECFHASENKQAVRNRVFEVIKSNLRAFRIDSLIIEKAKTGPSLRAPARFYPEMLGYLLKYVANGINSDSLDEVIVVTDSIPLKKHREAIKKAVKITLAEVFPGDLKCQVVHHSSKSSFGLQVVDYCNWAIYRKWKDGDARSYEMIRRAVKSEFDIFQGGTILYY